MTITWTKEVVQEILIESVIAWEEALNNKLLYKDLPIIACLGFWGRKSNNECLVCVAGARYLKQTGKLLANSKIRTVDVFIDSFRYGFYDRHNKDDAYNVFKSLDLKLPSPINSANDNLEMLRVLKEALEINFT